VLTGDMFSAREAFDMGLVSEVVPDPEVEGRALDLARQLAALPPLALQLAKEAVLAGMEAPLSSALALEAKSLQILFSSQDQKEGMRAFIEKRKPKFEGR
jgi:enoyl-CoA hydratase